MKVLIFANFMIRVANTDPEPGSPKSGSERLASTGTHLRDKGLAPQVVSAQVLLAGQLLLHHHLTAQEDKIF